MGDGEGPPDRGACPGAAAADCGRLAASAGAAGTVPPFAAGSAPLGAAAAGAASLEEPSGKVMSAGASSRKAISRRESGKGGSRSSARYVLQKSQAMRMPGSSGCGAKKSAARAGRRFGSAGRACVSRFRSRRPAKLHM